MAFLGQKWEKLRLILVHCVVPPGGRRSPTEMSSISIFLSRINTAIQPYYSVEYSASRALLGLIQRRKVVPLFVSI